MRDFQTHQVALFDGSFVPKSYRGRCSQPEAKKSVTRWTAVSLGVLLLGVTTAATAVTVRRNLQPETSLVRHSLSANMMRTSYTGGVEVALY